MTPEIEELHAKLRTANIAVNALERAIGDAQRACKHVRDPHDLNWCDRCGGILAPSEPPVLR